MSRQPPPASRMRRVLELARLDPRVKLMLTICISTLAVVWRSPIWLAALFAATACVLLLGGVDRGAALTQTRGVLKLIALLCVVQCVFVRGGTDLVSIGGITLLTSGGATTALAVTLRLLIVVLAALILLTGEARDYLLALVQCRVPYEIAFMTMTAVHFLPILRREALDVYYAVQMRGTEIDKATAIEKVRVYARIALPIVAGAVRRAEQVSVAMEARAFRALPHRTFMRRLTLTARDMAWLVLVPTVTAAALVASLTT
jgi:energy-coupling factor transport system permease protein